MAIAHNKAAHASHSAMYFPRITFPVLFLCPSPQCDRCVQQRPDPFLRIRYYILLHIQIIEQLEI